MNRQVDAKLCFENVSVKVLYIAGCVHHSSDPSPAYNRNGTCAEPQHLTTRCSLYIPAT